MFVCFFMLIKSINFGKIIIRYIDMKITKYLILGVFLFNVFTLSAQDKSTDKVTIKKWKDKKKKMSVEEYEKMKKELKDLNVEVPLAKKRIESGNDKLVTLKNKYALKQKELNNIKEDCNEVVVSPIKQDDFSKGVVFKVQIGAFEKNVKEGDIPLSTDFQVGAESEEQFYKIYAGYFRDYGQARVFKDYLKEMGAKEVFIVGFNDNVRVNDIKQALEQAGQSQYISE